MVFVVSALCVCAGAAWANPDAGERRFIREGMSESEVLQKIGEPDYKATAAADSSGARGSHSGKRKAGKSSAKSARGGGRGKSGAGKVWAYRPNSRDPQTLTLLTMAQGKVVGIERKVER
jgi:hypothetical protein